MLEIGLGFFANLREAGPFHAPQFYLFDNVAVE